MRFVDTNVRLYAASSLPEDADKRSRARALLVEPDLAVSVQVLQEFYRQATRPGRLSYDDALEFIEPFLSMRVQAVTLDVFQAGVSANGQPDYVKGFQAFRQQLFQSYRITAP